jgi:hypothetical protein
LLETPDLPLAGRGFSFASRIAVTDLTLSRASPLPQGTESFQINTINCGSGLAREEAITSNTKPQATKKPLFRGAFLCGAIQHQAI